VGIAAMVVAAVPIAARGQATDVSFRISPEDSVDLLGAARSSQAAFERLRRNRLPETWSSGGGHCDERIGRFCLTFGPGRANWSPPPEDEEVVEARDTLIAGLGWVAGLVPGDTWIAGQRVRYLVEARRFDEAVAAAAECRAAAWWCAALAG